jgi:hypothetical protein
MSKRKLILIISAVVGLVAIGVIAAYIYRNVQEEARVAVDQTVTPSLTEEVDAPTSQVTFTATLVGVDDLHWGRGTMEVIETQNGAVLSFKDDFEVAQGPDLFVYLSPNPAGEALGEFASLGNLKANSGAQEYNLPENYKDYKTVVIWCRAFAVTFATAELQ